MWISEQGRRRTEPDGTTLVGRSPCPATRPGCIGRRAAELPVFGPAAMCGGRRRASRCWCSRPARRRGPLCGQPGLRQDWNRAGEVLIYSGSASIRIGGGISG